MSDAISARSTAGGGRARRNRGGQGVSRNPSARSSAFYNDDYLHSQSHPQSQSQGYGYGYGSLGLRSTASRYSLNDQFAATRQEFEFGFDDGASSFERSTIASEAIGEQHESEEETIVLDPIIDYYDTTTLQGQGRVINPHDLLVLPPNPSPQDIRRAYFRLFVLLYPDAHPPKLRKAASAYFTLVQTAFEQLIGPERKLLQDLKEASTFDFVLDDPGRYQVYQLWQVPLGKFSTGSESYSAQDGQNTQGQSRLGDRWDSLSKNLARLGKWSDWSKHGNLGLGVKLDMGSPHLFETGAGGFSRFSVFNKQVLSLVPIRAIPRIELGYKLPSSLSWSGTKGSWSISTAAESQGLGASVNYGIDMDLSQPLRCHNTASRSSKKQLVSKVGRGLRFEAELSSGWVWSRFLALRLLKRVGRFSKCGFEVGFNKHHLLMSIYWSRLGQRVRLPFLVNLASSISPRLLFWTTLVPLAGLAAWDFISRRRSYTQSEKKEPEPLNLLQDRRAEADDITILLWANVGNRQDVERANRGLVILSAKWGIKKDESWGLEEVADVTTAVAALVDNSQLYLPKNVNKNNILGFWDPVPGAPKTLHIRYLFQGKEATVEVAESDELVLPSK